MKCETYGIFESFFKFKSPAFTVHQIYSLFKLGQNAPSLFRVEQTSRIMIVFKHFFVFQKIQHKILHLKI